MEVIEQPALGFVRSERECDVQVLYQTNNLGRCSLIDVWVHLLRGNRRDAICGSAGAVLDSEALCVRPVEDS